MLVSAGARGIVDLEARAVNSDKEKDSRDLYSEHVRSR